jgi:tRNA pseudouridine13 synthase
VGKLAGTLLGRLNRQKREAALRLACVNAAKLRAGIATVCDDSTAQILETFVVDLVEAQHESASNQRRVQGNADEEAKPSEVAGEFFFPEIADKDQRARVHALIREFAGDVVVSDTAANADGVSVVRVRKMMVNGKKRRDVDQRGNGGNGGNKWPASRPDYLQFTLYKKNVETNSVMQQLARAMNVNVSAFSYAGTKDKRGITTQQCTIYRGSKERLEMLNRAGRELDEFNFLVGDAKYVPAKLNLGDLRGNQFALAIRGLPTDDQVSDDAIRCAVDSWAERGFINYFGLQRFGTKSIPTHEIGRAILQRDHERAVRLLLQPQEGDATKIREARQKFEEDGNSAEALRAFPPYLIAERAVLQGLQAHGANAFSTALQCIPRHLRMVRVLLLGCNSRSG